MTANSTWKITISFRECTGDTGFHQHLQSFGEILDHLLHSQAKC